MFLEVAVFISKKMDFVPTLIGKDERIHGLEDEEKSIGVSQIFLYKCHF